MDLTDNGSSLEEAIEQLVAWGYDDHEIESAAYKLRRRLEKEHN